MRITRAQALRGLVGVSALPLIGCARSAPVEASPASSIRVAQSVFGATADGQEVSLFTLTNANGVEVKLTSYGAAITSVKTPDLNGTIGHVVTGFDELAPYLAGTPSFGATVGRFANRIARGRFTLDGVNYQLATNNGPNHLHGGPQGFDKRVWSGEAISDASGPKVAFTYVSADGEENYPGELTTTVTYALTEANEIVIDYAATTTKPTVINLTNHAYFNLSGDFTRDILGHQLTIDAARYLPVDPTLIPTGELAPVAGTPFDFSAGQQVGARINADNEQIRRGGGYDHCWALDGEGLRRAALLVDPESGRTLEVRTTEPGVQLYTANWLDGSLQSRGAAFTRRTALCLETQHFPDSPNQPSFPTTALRPGERFESRTIYAFGLTQAA